MPRKKPRPAARKAAEKRKAAMSDKPKPRVAVIGHHSSGFAGLALAALAAGMTTRKDTPDAD